MATFQIHEDAEKENSRAPKRGFTKENNATIGIVGNTKAKPLQNLTQLGIGLPSKQGYNSNKVSLQRKDDMVIKDQENVSNIASTSEDNIWSLKSQMIGQLNSFTKPGGQVPPEEFSRKRTKPIEDEDSFIPRKRKAFREVGNVKVLEENGVAIIGGATKKSTAKPVVEQWSSFAVYEDQEEQTNISKPTKTTDVEEQSTSQKPAGFNFKSEAGDNIDRFNFKVHDELNYRDEKEDSILDTTPMSVSEVLSPMSVDHSMMMSTTSDGRLTGNDVDDYAVAAHLIDNSKCNNDVHGMLENKHEADGGANEQRKQTALLPRNDRQRFFEVVEYQRPILEYFRESELKHRPKPQYMRRQNDINYSMRTILVDWLVEVAEEYNLDTETLYLSISYIDRFLSQMSVVRGKLQLVGTAAMYIASKYEEIYPPDVSEFVFITDDTYTKAQVLRMEQIILKVLSFDLCTSTTYVYTNTYAVLVDDMTDKLKFLTQYICELSLLEADPYLRFLPSLISSAALALARHTLGMPIWSAHLEDVTKYKLTELREVLLFLCKTHNAASTLAQKAMPEKYKAEKYECVSTIEPIQLDENGFDKLVQDYNGMDEKTTTAAAVTQLKNSNVRRMISQMMN